jgi:hypothetical protein
LGGVVYKNDSIFSSILNSTKMSFLKKLFGTNKDVAITNKEDFWNWFLAHEKTFFNCIQSRNNIEPDFLDKVMPNLQALNKQFYCLAGMYNDTTAELIVTAEGNLKTIVFVEELIAIAPQLPNWKFTALKPAVDSFDMEIKMGDYIFNKEKIKFYATEHEEYPDEIDITLVHEDYTEANKNEITNGTYIFLDNTLGEMNFATLIDQFKVAENSTQEELIPLQKLKDFLLWREKEFIEKYDAERYNSENDNYTIMQAEDENALPLIALVNQALLNWEAKVSHPWMLVVDTKYDGSNNNGLPPNEIYELMNQFEDELTALLPDSKGYLNLGRETYNGLKTTFMACKEYKDASKITANLIHQYAGKLDITYDIYKDKYWRTMNKFKNSA